MSHEEIDPPTAWARQQHGWAHVDVRSPEEFAAGHPAGAVNVPLFFFGPRGGEPNDRFVEVMTSRYPVDQPLLLFCRSGGRSDHACRVLAALGYPTLANVLGGWVGGPGPDGPVAGWVEHGLPADTRTDGCGWDALSR